MEEFEFLLRVSEFISLFQVWFNGEVMNKFVSFWMLKLLKFVCKVEDVRHGLPSSFRIRTQRERGRDYADAALATAVNVA